MLPHKALVREKQALRSRQRNPVIGGTTVIEAHGHTQPKYEHKDSEIKRSGKLHTGMDINKRCRDAESTLIMLQIGAPGNTLKCVRGRNKEPDSINPMAQKETHTPPYR